MKNPKKEDFFHEKNIQDKPIFLKKSETVRNGGFY